jgi:FKBP-type peptidyl-prolyl cis-trans isomerase
MSEKPKCTNVEECQALAEQKQREEMEAEMAGPPPKTTAKGTRYRDLETGSGPTVKDGNEVELYYKVLKLGKRSYDGLSGEGTVVFSRGYGLEDDEKEPGTKTFTTTVGAFQNIAALNDAIVGMNKGGIRRFSVQPQSGWERATKQCDGGPGGSGAGGDLKTD